MTTEQAKTAYETFRGGFGKNPCPAPPWYEAPRWVRDAVLVAYLQGRVDKGAELITELPDTLGRDLINEAILEIDKLRYDVSAKEHELAIADEQIARLRTKCNQLELDVAAFTGKQER